MPVTDGLSGGVISLNRNQFQHQKPFEIAVIGLVIRP
jgi:hypothetical protein